MIYGLRSKGGKIRHLSLPLIGVSSSGTCRWLPDANVFKLCGEPARQHVRYLGDNHSLCDQHAAIACELLLLEIVK